MQTTADFHMQGGLADCLGCCGFWPKDWAVTPLKLFDFKPPLMGRNDALVPTASGGGVVVGAGSTGMVESSMNSTGSESTAPTAGCNAHAQGQRADGR